MEKFLDNIDADSIIANLAPEEKKRGRPSNKEKTEETEQSIASKDVANVKHRIDFDAPDRLKMDAKFKPNPELEYRWAKKGPDLPFKEAEKGWSRVEGHSDRHDLVLMCRPKELSVQEMNAQEARNRRFEGVLDKNSEGLQGAEKAVLEAARAMGIDVSGLITEGRNHRRVAGSSTGRFYSIPQ